MSLAERAQNPPGRGIGGKRCSVRRLLEELPAEESVPLMGMLADIDNWPHEALEKTIREEGYEVGTSMVMKHRNGVCGCPKPDPLP